MLGDRTGDGGGKPQEVHDKLVKRSATTTGLKRRKEPTANQRPWRRLVGQKKSGALDHRDLRGQEDVREKNYWRKAAADRVRVM